MLKGTQLIVALTANLALATTVIADTGRSVEVIKPKASATPTKSAKIDTERFQLGVFGGLLAVEDFNNNPSYGLSLSYQISSKYLAQLNYGSSAVNNATFEVDTPFLSESQRDFTYYNLALGYQLYSARSFLGATRKYDTDIYLLAGVGSTEFGGDSGTSYMLGASYRVVLTDWLVWNIDVRDHLFSRTLESISRDSKMTQNVELATGLSILF